MIAIIGILATVVIASLNSARGKARDAARLATAKNIQTALEMHFAENGIYPETLGFLSNSGRTNLVNSLSPYISSLPNSHEYAYYRRDYTGCTPVGSVDRYIIFVRLESGSGEDMSYDTYLNCRKSSLNNSIPGNYVKIAN